MFVKSKDAQKLEKNIEEMTKENNVFKKLSVYNLEEQIKQEKSMILIISIFLYGFITVITLIGITNIFNTITTNMNLRSKEFAMLKSIGMTKKEFNKMIRLESIFYGSKALFFGIPLGLIGSYLIYKAFNDGLAFGYIFPLKAILLAILFVLVIIGIIMKYSLNKINKQNIIETIRNDNI
jgi:putative ABC transport system permease protein